MRAGAPSCRKSSTISTGLRAAGGHDLGRHLFEQVGAPRHQRQAHALAAERQRDAAADAHAGARHQRRLAFDLQVHVSLFVVGHAGACFDRHCRHGASKINRGCAIFVPRKQPVELNQHGGEPHARGSPCLSAWGVHDRIVDAVARGEDRYPSRPIALVLPYAAGGGTDAIARVFAKALEEALGGTIVVENRPGAGGNIATDAVSTARPDGYTLLIGNQGPMVVNPHLYKNMKSDPEQTLEPIMLIASAALVVVVGPSLKPTTLPELIAEAKRRPRRAHLRVGLQRLGQPPGDAAAGAGDRHQGRHVAYRGAAPALNDVVGGHVDFMVTTIPSVTGLIAAAS